MELSTGSIMPRAYNSLNARRQRVIQILIQHVTVTSPIKHEADGFLTHRSLEPWIEALTSTCFIVSAQTYMRFWKNEALTNMDSFNKEKTPSMIHTTSDGYLLIIDQTQG